MTHQTICRKCQTVLRVSRQVKAARKFVNGCEFCLQTDYPTKFDQVRNTAAALIIAEKQYNG